jgi:hypothetical protein
MSTTPEQLHILQHSLGVDKHGQGSQYRNFYVTGPESDTFAQCRGLVELGLMIDHGPRDLNGGMHTFTVTPKGSMPLHSKVPHHPS